jgi:hypothetical protein
MPKISASIHFCVKSGAALLLVLVFCGFGYAQAPATVSSTMVAFNRAAVAPEAPSSLLPEASSHKFWDRENWLLFSSVAALSAADFSVTHMNLENGGRELNPLVRPFAGNTATLAANFAGQTAGVVAISYLFHRSGHHRLERMTPTVNVAASAFAVAYGLSHR